MFTASYVNKAGMHNVTRLNKKQRSRSLKSWFLVSIFTKYYCKEMHTVFYLIVHSSAFQTSVSSVHLPNIFPEQLYLVLVWEDAAPTSEQKHPSRLHFYLRKRVVTSLQIPTTLLFF